jgi:hypothetical protein
MTSETTYIKQVYSWNSGGGIEIDIVELEDGSVLGITEESLVLYNSIEELQEGIVVNGNKTIFR